MCGIVGIIGFNGAPVDTGVLQIMNDLQTHRGPDGEGLLLSSLEAGVFQHRLTQRAERSGSQPVQVGLGHRRLAILDLSEGGLQPMSVGDSGVWIIFNGEIYNHREIRAELEFLGCTFSTRTDTEVLLQAYIRWGDDLLDRIDGMYAFAIWDGRRGRLLFARDRFGIKPLYYATPGSHFIFASEIKSLLAFPGLDREPDDEALLGFLAHGNCDYNERTPLKHVKSLPAGHSLTLEVATRQLVVKQYWRLKPARLNGIGDREKIDRLRELLFSSTRSHLISDVRAGSCLSGGLDSSTIVSLVGKLCREQPEAASAVGDELNTFTSCWEYKEIDEREPALEVARAASAKSHPVFPKAEAFWSDFQRMAWHQDLPFGNLSTYAQWSVMRAAKEAGVKVLLDGQGGDEVFGGYAKFRYAYMASLLRSGHPIKMLREAGATLRQGDRYVLDIRNGYRYLPTRLRSFLKVDSVLRDALRVRWDHAVSTATAPATRWWANASSARNGNGAWTAMQRIQIDDILIDTLPQLLRLEDRSSMAFSIEARVPLLDHKLVEYGLSLPDHLKISGGWSKFAVRQAMQGLMPENVRLRKGKLGFAAPDRAWLSKDLRRHVTELIEDDLRCQKYVDPSVIRRWYASPESRKANTESYLGLFRILSLEMWMRAFKIS